MRTEDLEKVHLALNIVGATLAVYFTARMVVGPDGMKTLKMAGIRSAARFAKRQGEWWTSAGAKLDSTYWKVAS
jgi:hypothetical protein